MSHRILVIDHHPQGLQRVVDPLRAAGYEVAVAQTVADGASAFGQFEPALVFIAARLPRTHGTVLCRELKRTDAGAKTPIVLIVESTGVQIDLPPLDQFGADRMIQKPVSADELLALCRELLEEDFDLAAPDNDETGSPTPAEPDDGLSIALEELDVLDFDVPDVVLGGAHDAPPPQTPAVRLSNDHGEDIEDRLEDLLTGKQKPTLVPMPGPEPSTGRDHDADAAVIDELDLDNELNAKLGADEEASASQPANPPPPRIPSATTTVSEPVPESERPAVKFQTEAFTSKRTEPQPFPAAADVNQESGLARWSWVAIPITVAVVFLAVFFMASPQETQPDTDFAATPPAGGKHDDAQSSASADAQFSVPPNLIFESDPPNDAIEPVEDVLAKPVIEKQPEVAPQDPAPRDAEPDPVTPAPIKTRQPDPVVESEPEPEPRNEAPAPQVQNVEDSPEPVVESTPTEPEPAAPVDPEPRVVVQAPEPQVQQVEDKPEPVVESTPTTPDPDPAPREVLPDPITRDPILIQRVEPRVSKKDLKKGGGTVVLRIRISASGSVTRVLVEQGLSGSPLEAAAVAAVLRWRYEPALDRDEPVEAWTTARFTFE